MESDQGLIRGGGGIRTHGAPEGSAVFKTAAFVRSATPPGSRQPPATSLPARPAGPTAHGGGIRPRPGRGGGGIRTYFEFVAGIAVVPSLTSAASRQGRKEQPEPRRIPPPGRRRNAVNGQVGGGGGIRTHGTGNPAQQFSRLPPSSARPPLPRKSPVSGLQSPAGDLGGDDRCFQLSPGLWQSLDQSSPLSGAN